MQPVLHVAEFVASTTSLPVVTLPPVREQSLAISGKSTVSRPFSENTHTVRLYADVDCTIDVGEAPEATTRSLPLGAGSEAYFSVPAGLRLAVIAR